MSTSLTQKLQLKPGQHMRVLNAPEGYMAQLAEALEEITVSTEGTSESYAVLLFVNGLAETEQLVPQAIEIIERDALFWIAYPKGTSKVKTDVNRDSLWKAVTPTGWRPVRQIALDDVWSAVRFRPAEKVGT